MTVTTPCQDGGALSLPPTDVERGNRWHVTQSIRSIDLFAGAGGLSLGFEMANVVLKGLRFDPVLAVENNPAAALTFGTNFGVPVYTDHIESFDPGDYPKVELLVGGPPCQGFSPLGRNRDEASRRSLNELWRYYIEAVIAIEPWVFVIENVPGFQRSTQFRELTTQMSQHELLREYRYSFGVLDALDYGVPQRRRRGIFIAARNREVRWPPLVTHGDGTLLLERHRTVRDAISDLPPEPTTDYPVDLGGKQDLHIRRNPTQVSLERYRAIPEGGNRFDLQRERPDLTPACWARKSTGTTDVMGRLWWDRPAFTIRTEFYKPEKGRYLHPLQDRPLTHREAARLQTFPDSFIFEGSKTEIARQIGNAVPPRLGRAIALHVAKLLGQDRKA